MNTQKQIDQQIEGMLHLAQFGMEEDGKDLLTYYWFKNGFSREECEKIKELAKSYDCEEATTFGDEGTNNTDDSIRKSSVRWINCTNDTSWIYEKLLKYVTEANKYFKTDITGFSEPLQYTEYEGKGTHYGYHLDIGPGKHKRKISIVVQLSDPSEYEGGELMIHNGTETVMDRGMGCVFLFPSILLHKVTKVISGNRHSLVSWISGSPWK